MVICLEGINGVGKSTQARLLVDRLRRERDEPVYLLRDPGVSEDHPANTKIRQLARFGEWENPMTRMMLYMAARCELISEIKKLRGSGGIVVLDRYAASYYAYGRNAFAQIAGEHWKRAVAHVLMACGASTPDLTILLAAKPETAWERVRALADEKPLDVFEREGLSRFEQLSATYGEVFWADEKCPYVGARRVGVSAEIADIEAVADLIWKEVDEGERA